MRCLAITLSLLEVKSAPLYEQTFLQQLNRDVMWRVSWNMLAVDFN